MLTECFKKSKTNNTTHVYERCGPDPSQEMVSRRKILSRSRDDLNPDGFAEDEEDVWHLKDKLFKDHIMEVLGKWNSIDDEIWAKVIVLERNRRVAKAYARAPVLTINGSEDGFDGFRIGLNGFDNPMRDMKSEEVKRMIGQGLKVKMDDSGNILVKRISRSNIYVKNLNEENAIGNDIMKHPNGALDSDKPLKLFDMKKFQQNVSKELKRSYPDRKKLETQCISSVAFVKNEVELLDCPCWIMIINVVAIDMLKSKLPPMKRIAGLGRTPMALFDEDPYSVAGSGSSGSSGVKDRELRRADRPPKLPPRDIKPSSPSISFTDRMPTKGDYDIYGYSSRQVLASQAQKCKPDKKEKKYDDPYYCGMRARIPPFVNSRVMIPQDKYKPGPVWMAPRLYDSGLDSDLATESPYAHIYGRLPLPNRIYTSPPPTPLYVGDWE